MSNFIVDPFSIEEDEEGVPSVKVFALAPLAFPAEIAFEGYYWDYVGGGFLTMEEAARYDSKATYKLRVKDKSETSVDDQGFQLY